MAEGRIGLYELLERLLGGRSFVGHASMLDFRVLAAGPLLPVSWEACLRLGSIDLLCT